VKNRKQKAYCQAAIKVTVDGRNCKALADAGATVSLIRHDLAKDLKLKLTRSHLVATGVTNDSLTIEGESLGNIRIGKEVYQQRLFVAKNISQELILGTDFLAKLGEVTYDFTNCTFKFGSYTIPMGEDTRSHAVMLTNNIKIPPLSEVAVVAHITSKGFNNKECLFEGTNINTSNKLLVGKALNRVKGTQIKIPVINTSKEFQEIHMNTVVGEIEMIDDNALLTTTVSKPPKKFKTDPGNNIDLSQSLLTELEKNQLRLLINEFADIIGEGISELGRTSIVQHVIETVPGSTPIRSKPYNIPIGLRAEVKEQLDEMQRQGLITFSSGEWTSPIVLIKKRDNTWRFCVDYRKLNDITIRTSMALSSIDNAAEIMHGKKYFSTIDLCSGFFQVQLHEESQEKSEFITPWGPYKWKVMPQGASGSPSTFARLSLAIMADLIREGSSCVYLDDWLMTSADFQSHLKLLRTVFMRLRYAGLKFRLSKSHFCQKQVLYLGHVISQNGMAVATHNVDKITKFPNPRDKTGVKRLLGLFGFYRNFIKGFSQIAAPLVKLTNKESQFEWSEDCQRATDELKSRISSAPILKFPDFSKQFILTTDASSIALGGVLSQNCEDGREHPVSFFSKSLTSAEHKWNACELELYAILFAVKHYKHYLLNTHFRVRTDNIACTYILKKAELSPRLARWAIQLSEYDFEIEHTPGKHNNVADALSRAEQVGAIEHSADRSPEEEEMRRAQTRDFYLGPIFHYIETGKFPTDMSKRNVNLVKKDSENFQIINGIIYRIQGPNYLLAIPKTKRKALLHAHHESLMSLHPGITKTMLKLKSKYWFPHMQREVEKHVNECGSCQRRKNPQIPMRVPLKNQMAEYPFQVLSMDFQGPFVESEQGNKHILVFTDHFTKWCEMVPTTNQHAVTVANVYVERIFCRYGASEILISDRAKNFLSDVIRHVNKLLGVDHRLTSPYHPQTNGQVEVHNRSIANMISHVVAENHRDWDKFVPFCQLAHNSSRHTVINASPSMLLMCREVRLPFDLTQPSLKDNTNEGEYASQLHSRMTQVWQLAREQISHGKAKQKKYYDKKSSKSTIKVGDAVLYFNRRGYKNRTSKLIKRWTGIYIVKWRNETNADIQLFDQPDTAVIRVHLNTLKQYRGPLVRGESSTMSFDFDSPHSETSESSETDSEPPSPTETDIEPDKEHENSSQNSTFNEGALPKSKHTNSDANNTKENDDYYTSTQLGTRPQSRHCERYGLRRRPKRKQDKAYHYSK